ncbi:MAG: 50S ribosomal protein L17 [Desulfohalobiaceae bacterium]
MRHKKSGRKLGRTWEHRKALFKNLARALVAQEKIQTTEPKAKELRRVTDRLVSFGLKDTVHARRQAYKILESRTLVQKLFQEIAPRYVDRPGGYTRIIKVSRPRRGDGASMAVVQFTPESSSQKKA